MRIYDQVFGYLKARAFRYNRQKPGPERITGISIDEAGSYYAFTFRTKDGKEMHERLTPTQLEKWLASNTEES